MVFQGLLLNFTWTSIVFLNISMLSTIPMTSTVVMNKYRVTSHDTRPSDPPRQAMTSRGLLQCVMMCVEKTSCTAVVLDDRCGWELLCCLYEAAVSEMVLEAAGGARFMAIRDNSNGGTNWLGCPPLDSCTMRMLSAEAVFRLPDSTIAIFSGDWMYTFSSISDICQQPVVSGIPKSQVIQATSAVQAAESFGPSNKYLYVFNGDLVFCLTWDANQKRYVHTCSELGWEHKSRPIMEVFGNVATEVDTFIMDTPTSIYTIKSNMIQTSNGIAIPTTSSMSPFPNMPPGIQSVTYGDGENELVIFDINGRFHIYSITDQSYRTGGDVCIQ